ncbi:MAG TPA: hypothetical protein VF173_18450 [Thermoanaerobaculia bacterium]|nr:hypothetical protein [Thermoanaerobaculia bacterium]
MIRMTRMVPAVLFALGLALGPHAAAAQEPSETTARTIAEIRNGVNRYSATTQRRLKELERKIDVLSQLTEAADTVSPIAMTQSLSRARQKVEEAQRDADKEPALGEPVPTVLDIVSHIVTTPPFGVPADQLRARLFVEISKLEEDVLQQCDAFQKEASTAEALEQTLGQIQRSLRAAAVAGGRASIVTRRRALKSGS